MEKETLTKVILLVAREIINDLQLAIISKPNKKQKIGGDGMKINKKDLMLTLDEIVNCESVRLCEVDRDLYEFIQGG